jgi:hypothetical protein
MKKAGQKLKKSMDQIKIKSQQRECVGLVHRVKVLCINNEIKNSEHMLCNPSYLGNGGRRTMV